MKNNTFFLVLSIVIGINMGAYFPSSKIGYVIFNILRGIR